MEPSPFFEPWINSTTTPDGWPTGMALPWPIYPPPLPFSNFEMQPMQQLQQSELADLQPMQIPLSPQPSSSLIHYYDDPHGMITVGNENAPPPSSFPSSDNSFYDVLKMVKEYDSSTLFPVSSGLYPCNGESTPHLSSTVDGREESFPFPSSSPIEAPKKRGRPRGKKRKKAGGDDGDESSITCPSSFTHRPFNDKSNPIVSSSSEAAIDWLDIPSSSSIVPPMRKRRRKDNGKKEEVNPSIPHPVSIDRRPTTEFCKAHGRLSMTGSVIEYSVTTDEIARRISLPEGFARDNIKTLLRRGKVKGSGDELQSLLETHGLSFTEENKVNRRQVPHTIMSGFLEGEAMKFSSDHRSLIKDHFPFTPLARLIIRDFTDSEHLAKVAAMVKDAQSVMVELTTVLSEWTKGGWEKGMDSILASPLKQFSLTTHGLGIEECLTMTSLFSRLIRILDEECTDHNRRLKEALAVNPHSCAHTNKFPTNLEQPELPTGQLHVPDMEEQANAPSSFDEIEGRLSMGGRSRGNLMRYNITVGEVLRRLRHPESLTLSILGSLLRRGKTKGKTNDLHAELADKAIDIRFWRRKEADVTAFTALSEGEAIKLAKDMDDEIDLTFPDRPLIEALIKPADYSTSEAFEAREKALQAVSTVALMLRDLVRKLRLPVADRFPHRQDPRAYIILNYCSVTHGYGPDAVCSWLAFFRNLFDEAIEFLHAERDKKSKTRKKKELRKKESKK